MRLVLSQLIDQLKMPHAPGQTQPYPRLRNFLQDALAEGKRKHIAHIVLEADIGGIKERLAQLRQRGEEPVSMTSYIAKSFACAIETDKRMQAYRLGKSRLMVFDDIDLAFMIEREWEDEPIPVFYILRAAQHKSAAEIHRALQVAKQTPLGTDGPMNALEMQFFLLPRFLRKAVWFVIRRNPYWFKDVAGTAAVTSMGMYTAGAAVGIPITPMTLTLTIGTIEKKPSPAGRKTGRARHRASLPQRRSRHRRRRPADALRRTAEANIAGRDGAAGDKILERGDLKRHSMLRDQRAGPLDDIARCNVDRRYHLLDFFARRELDRAATLLQFHQELTVLPKFRQCFPQRGDAVRRSAFRYGKRPSRLQGGEQKVIEALILLILDIFHGRRNLRQIRISLQRKLHDDVDFLLLQPVRMISAQCRPWCTRRVL